MAAPLPRFSGSTTTWSAPALSAASAVPSVEPSSTTTTSSPPSAASGARAARMATMVAPMRAASSRAGTMTEARSDPGRGAAAPVRGACGARRRAARPGRARAAPPPPRPARRAWRRRARPVDEKPWAAYTPAQHGDVDQRGHRGHRHEGARHPHPAHERVGAERHAPVQHVGHDRRHGDGGEVGQHEDPAEPLAQQRRAGRRRPPWAPAPRGRSRRSRSAHAARGAAGSPRRARCRSRRLRLVGRAARAGQQGEDDRQPEADQR